MKHIPSSEYGTPFISHEQILDARRILAAADVPPSERFVRITEEQANAILSLKAKKKKKRKWK